MKYFGIKYQSRRNWFAEIIKEFHKTDMSNWPDEYVYGLNTKFDILTVLLTNINRAIRELDREFSGNQSKIDKCVAERGKVARAYPLKNPDLAFRTVTALECFIVEAFATWQIAGAFAVKLCRNLGQRIQWGAIEKELKSEVDISWLKKKKLRNWNIHEGSIWIAVEVSSYDAPRSYKLVILLRNTLDLADSEDWIYLDELDAIYQGLNRGLMGLHNWLIKRLKEAHTGASPSPKAPG